MNFRNKKRTINLYLLSSLVAVIFLFTSCDDNDDVVLEPTEVAYVSIYHGSPNTTGLDIDVGNGPINVLPFEYEDYSGYLNFYPGNRHFVLAENDNPSNIVLDTTFTFFGDDIYSIFIADSLSSLEAIAIEDNFVDLTDDISAIRFIHLSPDTEAVNVLADAESIFEARSFKDGTDFIPIEEGRVTLEVKSDENDEVLLTVPNVDLEDHEYYTVILNGYQTPPEGNINELSSDIIRH